LRGNRTEKSSKVDEAKPGQDKSKELAKLDVKGEGQEERSNDTSAARASASSEERRH